VAAQLSWATTRCAALAERQRTNMCRRVGVADWRVPDASGNAWPDDHWAAFAEALASSDPDRSDPLTAANDATRRGWGSLRHGGCTTGGGGPCRVLLALESAATGDLRTVQGISQSASEEAGYDSQRFAVTISRVRGQWWPVGVRGADPVERLIWPRPMPPHAA